MRETDLARVDPGNAEQLRAWDTAEGVFWAEEAELFEHALHRYDDWLLRAAGIQDGDQVLDLGCGSFQNIGRATKPGGRLALLSWRAPQHNEWFTALTTALAAGRELPTPPPGAPSPFAQADPERVTRVLVEAGFAIPEFEPLTEPMYFGPDVPTAQRFVLGVLGWLLTPLDKATKALALEALRADLQAHLTPDGVAYSSSAWLITSRCS
ncbi:hypothetical protein GCM10009789_79810 [Kribbella sancticallisti]|uniref:Methyltransferase domain-containing protein n=1 Tax=Kribbella sancticallisti TaxID=460087 RepID=A0ABN2EPE2_9ACTN